MQNAILKSVLRGATFSCQNSPGGQTQQKERKKMSSTRPCKFILLSSLTLAASKRVNGKSGHSVSVACSWFPGPPWDHHEIIQNGDTTFRVAGLFHSFTRIVLLVIILNFTAALRLGSRCSPWTLSEIPHQSHLHRVPMNKDKRLVSQPQTRCMDTSQTHQKLTINNPVVTAQGSWHEWTELILTISGTRYHPLLSC